MTYVLRQSTSVDIPVGPFLDSTDGNTQETALTLTQPDIRLKKNNANWAQKAAAQTLTHEEFGWYELTLDATDTGTLGMLKVAIHESGALPVWLDCWIVPANIWDSWFAADLQQVDTREVGGTTQTAGDIMADTNDIQTRLPATLNGGNMRSSVEAMAANTMTAAAAAADLTTELQAGLATAAGVTAVGAFVDTEVATILADTTTLLARLTALRAGYLDNLSAGPVAQAAALATTDARLDTEIPAIKTVTDNLATALELDGAVYRFTTNALEQSPAGGGGAPTAAAVADAVWDEAIAGHLGAGSTGAKLNGLSGAAGSGAITHTITVTENGVPVDGALVWVTTDSAGANVVASGFTDALGEVDVFLDAGQFYQWAQLGGTNFVNGTAFTVA